MSGAESPNKHEAPRADPALEYTPRFGPTGPVTVRGIRLLVALTLVNTTLLGMSVAGPQLFPFVRQSWQQWQVRRANAQARKAALALQQQCLNHAMTPGQVVYDEDPVEGEKRLNDAAGVWKPAVSNGGGGGGMRYVPPGWIPPVRVPAPGYFQLYLDAVYGGRVAGVDEPLLYLGERTTPGGARHVVTVQFSPGYDFTRSRTDATGATAAFRQTKGRTITAVAFPAQPEGPAGAGGKRVWFSVDLVLPDTGVREVAVAGGDLKIDQPPAMDYGNILRFMAGQPDPADPSHFTIPYELDGRAGVIDGWLRDDGLKLRPREGQWAFTSDGQAWKLPSGPAASRPAVAPAPGTVP